jgi:hypothetical protein
MNDWVSACYVGSLINAVIMIALHNLGLFT